MLGPRIYVYMGLSFVNPANGILDLSKLYNLELNAELDIKLNAGHISHLYGRSATEWCYTAKHIAQSQPHDEQNAIVCGRESCFGKCDTILWLHYQ
jgi:hypothetical protein